MSTIKETSKIYDAVKAIEKNWRRLVVVINQNDQVVGTITDGDLRRYLLTNNSLEQTVTKLMNCYPMVAFASDSNTSILQKLKENNIAAIPLVDCNAKFLKIVHAKELGERGKRVGKSFATSVLMAGGQGVRLRPITNKLPKPMIRIEGIPILEHQINFLKSRGIDNIYIAINYLGEIIENYFGDGSNFDVKINYLREEQGLGTAGALKLLPKTINGTILVMNGDILTSCDINQLYNYHIQSNSHITIGTINYQTKIPFGVFQYNNKTVTSIIEKPTYDYNCNAGIYCLETSVLGVIDDNGPCQFNDFINKLILKKYSVETFTIHEYWTDIGNPSDLTMAEKIYKIKKHEKYL